ncbi:MAG: prepilin-type N-terminal cleavage/methylation domain-containing protein [Polyangiaceae bacterium]|jgi:general secretion pathway protein J|nr:prepilin-type N-terminal cleavage/methylation domain-containing protein [Polyangiaceae bacterium]
MSLLPRARQRALTLLEILVAVTIMAMVAILIYGAFDGVSRSKIGLARLNSRFHQGRAAMRRLAHELSGAYISLHLPFNQALIASKTVFISKEGSPADRLDMSTFSHRRVTADARESDQNELSYFGCPDPEISGKIDLCRREQAIIDFEPGKGGSVHVVAEDIDLFDLKYLDPQSGLWVDSWDSTQAIGQPNRLPIQARITLVLRGGPGGRTIKFEEKVSFTMVQPLTFAVPR